MISNKPASATATTSTTTATTTAKTLTDFPFAKTIKLANKVMSADANAEMDHQLVILYDLADAAHDITLGDTVKGLDKFLAYWKLKYANIPLVLLSRTQPSFCLFVLLIVNLSVTKM